MINFISAVSDAFTNPDSPWYYVVGVVFLLLVFAALAVFIVISGKKKKAKEAKEKEQQQQAEADAPAADEDEKPQEQAAPVANEIEQKTEEPQETIAEEQTEAKPIEEEKAEEPQEKIEEEPEQKQEEPKPVAQRKKEPAEKKAPAPKKNSNVIKSEAADDKKPAQKPAAAKPKKATATKPFIDRLIAAKDLHGVYNELKNTVLSYPGIKAKLSKENEVFLFGTDKKAAFELATDAIILKLYIDPTTAPKQLGAQGSGDAELPTQLEVKQDNIDNAQKLIIFAMNVALLTRNDRHRHVDYVKNAINAKAKAKKK